MTSDFPSLQIVNHLKDSRRCFFELKVQEPRESQDALKKFQHARYATRAATEFRLAVRRCTSGENVSRHFLSITCFRLDCIWST